MEENSPASKPKDKDACLRELGYAMVYMKYLRPHFLTSQSGKDQYKRVDTLLLECAVEWRREPWWWEQFYGTIMDEIENMC